MQDEYNDQMAPVEETPGYVGHVFDEFVVFEEGLKPLDGFDFSRYSRLERFPFIPAHIRMI
jgi:hypothetical protein